MIVVWDKIKEAWAALVAAFPATSAPPSIAALSSRGSTLDRFALEDHTHGRDMLAVYTATGTTLTFTDYYDHSLILGQATAPATYTIDTFANAPVALGYTVEVENNSPNASSITIALAGGVTLTGAYSASFTVLFGQTCRLTKIGTNAWLVLFYVSFGGTVTTIGATSSLGISNALPRVDHTHNHGALGYYDNTAAGRMHTLAVAGAADGFMSATDKAALAAPFITLTVDANLANERALGTAYGHAPVDGGPGAYVYFAHVQQTASLTSNYTFVASDRGGVIQYNNSSTPGVFTIPSGLWPVGSEVFVQQVSSAQVSIAAGSGVSILIPLGTAAKTRGPNSRLHLTNVLGQNVWTIAGDLESTTPFLTLGNTSDLAGERALSPQGGLKLVDGGAGGQALLSREPGLLGLGAAGTTVLTPANVQPEYAVRAASASGTPVIELPSDATSAWAVGTRFDIFATNLNNATLQAGSGATATFFHQLAGVATGTAGPVTLYCGNFVYAIKVAANTWHVFGVWDQNYATASNNAPYVTIGNDSRLNGERALSTAYGHSVIDNGAGSSVWLAHSFPTTIQTGNYTFTAADLGSVVQFNNASSPGTFTIPSGVMTAGSEVFVLQIAAAQVTIAAGAGVTLTLPPGATAKTRGVNSIVHLRNIRGTDVWTAAGDLESSASGGVQGPSSVIDQCIAVFDGTTGKLLKASNATLDVTGNIVLNNCTAYGSLTAGGFDITGAVQAPFITATNTGALPNERAIQGRIGIITTDGGAGGSLYIDSTNDYVNCNFWSSTTATLDATQRGALLIGQQVDAARTLTVPADATYNAPIGFRTKYVNRDPGYLTTLAAASGASFVSLAIGFIGTSAIVPPGGVVEIIKVFSNTWMLIGDVAASKPRGVTATAYTFTNDDLNATILGQGAANQTFTIPAGLGVIGSRIKVIQQGTYIVYFAVSGGAVLSSAAGLDLRTRIQGSVVELECVAANTWYISGDLDPFASYLMVANNSGFSYERALAATDGLALSDAGGGSSLTLRQSIPYYDRGAAGSYTTVLADAYSLVSFSPATTVTIPPNSAVPYPIGTKIWFGQSATNAAFITLAAGAGVTIAVPMNRSAKTCGGNAVICAHKVLTDYWILTGDLADTLGYVVYGTTVGRQASGRVLAQGTGITFTDGGAGGNLTISVSPYLTSAINVNGAISTTYQTGYILGVNGNITLGTGFTMGTVLTFYSQTSTQYTITGSGTTIQSASVTPTTPKFRAQYSIVSATLVNTNVWLVGGDIV